MRRDLEGKYITEKGLDIHKQGKEGDILYSILSTVYALKKPSVTAYFGPEKSTEFLVDEKVGICGYYEHLPVSCVVEKVADGFLNAAAYLYASNVSLEKVPEELLVCLEIDTQTDGCHFVSLIAKMANFRQIYLDIEQRLKDQQVAVNELSKVEGMWLGEDFYEIILPLKDKIINLLGGTHFYTKKKDFKIPADFDNSPNAEIILKEITKNKKIDLIHFDSIQNGGSFNAIKSHIDTKQEIFNKPQKLACSRQQGQTCPEHSAYNSFVYSHFGKIPVIKELGTVSSADLRKLSTSRPNFDDEDYIQFVAPYIDPYLKVENVQTENKAVVSTPVSSNTPDKQPTQKELAIKNIKAFARQLRDEYQKKHKVLWFLCPLTKQNKAARLEKLAAVIEAGSGDWMKLVVAEKQFADSHPFQSIISHRNKNLLGNIIDGKAEKGILDGKEKVTNWVPGKARFW